MTFISKNIHISKLDDKVNKYNNTYHRAIKMKLVDIKSSTYIDFIKENDKERPKFKVHGHATISKYKNILAKGYVPNCSQEVFVTEKVKDIVP